MNIRGNGRNPSSIIPKMACRPKRKAAVSGRRHIPSRYLLSINPLNAPGVAGGTHSSRLPMKNRGLKARGRASCVTGFQSVIGNIHCHRLSDNVKPTLTRQTQGVSAIRCVVELQHILTLLLQAWDIITAKKDRLANAAASFRQFLPSLGISSLNQESGKPLQ